MSIKVVCVLREQSFNYIDEQRVDFTFMRPMNYNSLLLAK